MDRILDRAESGPVFLKQPDIAQMVVQAVIDGGRHFKRYELHSFVVMANHVHMLVTTSTRTCDWVRSLKGFTGHEANRILNRRNQYLWQDESFDRLVRTDEEFSRIRHYIEWNPVKAGLVMSPEEFPWSGPTPGRSPAAGRNAWPHL